MWMENKTLSSPLKDSQRREVSSHEKVTMRVEGCDEGKCEVKYGVLQREQST